MMRSFNALGLGLVALAGFGACSDGGNTPESKTNVALAVAPLNLPGISDACYDIDVSTAADQVWFQGNHSNADAGSVDALAAEGALCASQYGNAAGGDIAYVGPCDAAAGSHNITLWIENIFTAPTVEVPDTEWDNPCPTYSNPNDPDGVGSVGEGLGCVLAFTCVENQDVAVTFNIVLIRDANQGFFDVAVNFKNIFCSAKLDTCNNGGTAENNLPAENNLLFNWGNPATGGASKRVQTAVLAFACSGGTNLTGNDQTTLYSDEARIECANANYTLPMGNPEGQQFRNGPDRGLIQWALYRGSEQLPCDAQPDGTCRKVYWNLAFALDPTNVNATNCTIHTEFSAGGTDMPFGGGGGGTLFPTPSVAGAVVGYPYLAVDVNLTDSDSWVDQEPGGGIDCINVEVFDPTPSFSLLAKFTESSGGVFVPEVFCSSYTGLGAPGDVPTNACDIDGLPCTRAPCNGDACVGGQPNVPDGDQPGCDGASHCAAGVCVAD